MIIGHYVITYHLIQNARPLIGAPLCLQLIYASTIKQMQVQTAFSSSKTVSSSIQINSHTILVGGTQEGFYSKIYDQMHREAASYEDIIEEVVISHFTPKYSGTYSLNLVQMKESIYEEDVIAESAETVEKEKVEQESSRPQLHDNTLSTELRQEERGGVEGEVEDLCKRFKAKDETKNIPKNYIKAIFAFILENPTLIKKLLLKKRVELDYLSLENFIDYVRTEKRVKRYTIDRLKSLWLDEENGKAMRIISSHFLRRRALGYIFSSKIDNKSSHVRHRGKLLSAIEKPGEFNSIK